MARSRAHRTIRRLGWGLVAVIVITVGAVLVWSQVGVMEADPDDVAAVRSNDAITLTDAAEGIVLSPTEGTSEIGFVFIPGAKVDPLAYAPLLQDIVAEERVTVVITRPWLNLAFFDPRGLDAFTTAAPHITSWIVGGHSLGGVRACQLSADANALILFASYCAVDLSASEHDVLSVSGSEDRLTTAHKIADARHLLPEDATFVEIDGASHASFGSYGDQAGDGTATLTLEQMRAELDSVLEPLLADVRAAD